MRFAIFLPLLILALGCAGSENTTLTTVKLDGTWVPVSQELGGKSLPKPAFEKQMLIISDSSYVMSAESIDKGMLKYADGKMDIYGREGVNSGKHFTARYKYEDDKLTICYNLAGDSYPEGFETKGRPTFFLSLFTRETTK